MKTIKSALACFLLLIGTTVNIYSQKDDVVNVSNNAAAKFSLYNYMTSNNLLAVSENNKEDADNFQKNFPAVEDSIGTFDSFYYSRIEDAFGQFVLAPIIVQQVAENTCFYRRKKLVDATARFHSDYMFAKRPIEDFLPRPFSYPTFYLLKHNELEYALPVKGGADISPVADDYAGWPDVNESLLQLGSAMPFPKIKSEKREKVTF